METKAVSEPVGRWNVWVIFILFALLHPALSMVCGAAAGPGSDAPRIPNVRIDATRANTSEPAPNIRVAPGEFTVRRTGDLRLPLFVTLDYSGTALPRADYDPLPEVVEIRAGESEATLEVVALDDDVVEGLETVVATIRPPFPIGPFLPRYAVDPEHSNAEVAIRDTTKETGDPRTPIVRIEATRPVTSEPIPTALILPGEFTVRSETPVETPVEVILEFSGTAMPGEDYTRLPVKVLIPEGTSEISLRVIAHGDEAVEGTETVVATIAPAPVVRGQYPAYAVDPKHVRARVEIRDADEEADNHPPRVAIQIPTSGSVFDRGEVIHIEAVAEDKDGNVTELEVFAGDQSLGSTHQGVLALDWADAATGLHKLVAQAVDEDGAKSVSKTVLVFVRDPADRAFVRRVLPPAYLPGRVLEVHLWGNPRRGSGAWIVEDAPPAGWEVSGVSDDGQFDPATGRVKFGPYTDGHARELVYRVLPAADAAGDQRFTGRSSVDGEEFPVAGDDLVSIAGSFHPADTAPQDSRMVADEVTAYASAWKEGEAWVDGSSIPLSYVARAAFLWKMGETYAFDPTHGVPPECWFPPGSSASLHGFAVPGYGTAERDTPIVWKPGLAGEVRIDIEPPEGTIALTVEEIVPRGWKVRDISDGGTFDARAGRIRWGVLFGEEPRRLTFRAVPPAGTSSTGIFVGHASFDGTDRPVGGPDRTGSGDASTQLWISNTRRGGDGSLRLRIEAPVDQVFVVEASADLRTWVEIDAHVFTGDEIEVHDPLAHTGVRGRYYRLRPLGP